MHGLGEIGVRIFVILRAAVVCVLCGGLFGQDNAAEIRRRAREAEKKGDSVNAYLLYAQAAALDPEDRASWGRSLALRTQAALKANVRPVGDEADFAPEVEIEGVTEEEAREALELRPPPRLKPNGSVHTFDLKGDSRAVWEQAGKLYGFDLVFDSDYQPVTNIRFRMSQAGGVEALAALELATASFLTPVNERMGLVARETNQKRQEFEHTIAISVPIPEPVTLPEAQELARSVQQLMDIQKFGIDSVRRIVVIKDRESKVIPALAVLRQLLHHRPEVAIEVEFLEVIENSALDYGLTLPGRFGLGWFGDRLFGLRATQSIPDGFRNLVTFGGGKTLFGLGVASAEAFATFSNGSTRTLIRTELRATDGQAAQFHVGDKYPILTTGYFGTTTGSGEVFTPPPTFNFEDLGVVLKVTPKVHGWDEISLDVEGDFKVLTGEALNGIPVIANRKFQSRTRVRTGEWALLAGLVRATEARAITGIAGLSQIPGLGVLFRQNSRSRDEGQTLLVIKPRLLSAPLSEVETRKLWTGTETRPVLPR